MTAGPGGHDSETAPGPSSDRPSTRDTSGDTSPNRFRFTRRRMLLGLTATTVASVGTGAGLAVLDHWSQWSEAAESSECGVMVTSIGGPDVRVSPPLIVSRLAPGTSQRRRVQVVIEDEFTGSLALQFRQLDTTGKTDEARPATELAEQLEISVNVHEETLRNGTFQTVFDGTSVGIERQTRSGTTLDLSLDWRLPDGVSAEGVHGVLASALRFLSAADDTSSSGAHRPRA